MPSAILTKLVDTLHLPGDWMSFADEAIKAMFVLCDEPQQAVSGLLAKMLEKTHEEKVMWEVFDCFS